jgi:3-dehydroquinate synthetase/predicted NBD/HSP70 family sugar kinase
MNVTTVKGNLVQNPTAQASPAVVVFDIGGTWFRSGIVTSDGRVAAITRREAINYKNTPHTTVTSLHEALVDYLVKEVSRLRAEFPQEDLHLAGISMGAALNAHTGRILNSGPLWGPNCLPLDLLTALQARENTIQWTIVNDITAALLQYVWKYETSNLAKLTLVTVSTGIGCRTWVRSSQSIPVDRVHGLQGEIGHLPISFAYKGRPLELYCDCGGLNHLNAFCSGRGIEALLPLLAAAYIDEFRHSLLSEVASGVPELVKFEHFGEAVLRNDVFAISILDAVTLPIAHILLSLFTLDPEIERVIFTGGVIHRLAEKYMNSLLSHLDTMELYQISANDPSFFRQRIQAGTLNDDAGLLGAAISAMLQIASIKPSSSAKSYQRVVQAQMPVYYSIVESRDLFTPENVDILSNEHTHDRHTRRRFVVIEDQVDKLYGERIRSYLQYHKVDYSILTLSTSEQSKTINLVLKIIKQLNTFGLTRRSEPIIAIGGGILLDIVGLAASLYRRGSPYIRVPTTLVSLIDTSVGIKTGVNFQGHKSRIGTYYPPLKTLLDKTFLRSLDDRQISSGLAEMLKIAMVKDRELFELLEKYGDLLIAGKFQDEDVSTFALRRAVQGMIEELEPNLWEHNLNRLVDFGHSFSPTIEMAALPELLHGEAVAVDMALSTLLAKQRRLLNATEVNRVLDVMRKLKLPLIHTMCDAPFLCKALQDTIRHRDGILRLVLPVSIGTANFFNDVTFKEIETAVNALKQLA